MKSLLKAFGFSSVLTLAALGFVLAFYGASAAGAVLVLIIIEVAFSFDNAVVNAKILRRLSHIWQTLFLTAGILIAVLGMRIIFPIIIVAVTARLGFGHVAQLALARPDVYASKLQAAHPVIAAFGGAFLLALALAFFLDKSKNTHWFTALEQRLAALGNHWWPLALTLAVLVVLALVRANHHTVTTLVAGALGLLMHLGLRLLDARLGVLAPKASASKVLAGRAALGAFVYLEILDASFSFDGVLGAFAITSSVVFIAIGLGVGAFWVRSLTVHMVRRGTLDKFPYLEHGAYYTILALALVLLLGIFLPVPSAVPGAVGIVLIGAALVAPRRAIDNT
jgi:hypothetical protein